MVMRVMTTDQYFYEKKHSLLLLEMRVKPKEKSFFIDRDACENQAQEQLQWFKDRGIDSAHTVSPGTLAGWTGLYYIDIDPSDPLVQEYSDKFEDKNGQSLKPDVYQMILMDYQAWVDKGGIERHEQLLRDLADPNYNP